MNKVNKLLKSWIESYEKDSNTYRVLVGKSGNILRLMKQVRQETLKEVMRELEYNDDTISFCEWLNKEIDEFEEDVK